MTDHSDWIGRRTERLDTVTGRLAEEFRVTIGALRAPDPMLAGIHWCLAPDHMPAGDLGRDGHPRHGLVLPELSLPRRMWAGGEIAFHGGLGEGETVSRVSTVRDITFKTGRSGPLGFVAVEHVYQVDGDVRVREVQNIVYREDPGPGPERMPPPAEDWVPLKRWHATPDPTLLFRYSAITFNGHRIHYDHPYATGVEGYAGLVVHGPLQSTWMQNLAAAVLGRLPARFVYRGLAPLTVGQPVSVEVRAAAEGLDLRVRRDADGVVTMEASAS